jgi:HD-like signal output (HDOD) protein
MVKPPSFQEVCEKALRLPCSPTLLPRLVTVLQSDDATIEEIEEVIKLDPALASSTLRLANSAYFGSSGSACESLSEALMRLGQKEVFRLAALSMAGRWMTQKIEGYGWGQGDFCRFSLVTAVACEYLAEQSGKADPRIAYTAGLIHEIGKLAVAYSCADFFPLIRAHQKATACTWLEAEAAVLGYTHATLGAELLTRWKFSPTLVATVVHNPPTASAPADVLPLLVVVHAAKYLAVSMGAGVSDDGFLFSLNTPLLVEWGFSPEVLERALPAVHDRATRLLHEKLSVGAIQI